MSVQHASLWIGRDECRAVSDLAHSKRTYPVAVLVAAIVATAHRYTLREQGVVGLPGGIGLRVDTSSTATFPELVAATAERVAERLASSPRLLPELPRTWARETELVETELVVTVDEETGAGGVRPLRPEAGLTLSVHGAPDGLHLAVLDAAHPREAARWLTAMHALLADGLQRPAAPLDSLRMLPAGSEAEVVARVNGAAETYPDLQPIHAAFEAHARRRPDLVAIETARTETTYGELDGRANELAHVLAASGVGREDSVGVCCSRSVDQVVAVLATLKAGAAFVPLDPRQPPQRIATIAASAPLSLVLTDDAHLATLKDQPVPVLVVASRGTRSDPPATGASLDNAAFVYYTSGSTGIPKGVVIDHRCAAGRLEWLGRRYGLGEGDRVVYKTPLVFDVAIWEIFGPLAAGATMRMAEPMAESDVGHVSELLAAKGTVFCHFVPSMLNAYLDLADDRRYPDLRFVQLSGEAVSPRLVERYAQHFDVPLHNMYGQTETSEVAAWEGRDVPSGRRVPIGRQIGIYRVFVVDSDLRVTPVGVPGELCVAGVGGLARGYGGNPALTAERFVANPYARHPGERLYRTGDLAVVDDDGEISFLGRVDAQVKIRGCRVEPGEVEATLARHDAVRACAVVPLPDEAGDLQLVAYVVGDAVEIAGVAALAEAHLPSYMLPAAYVRLAALPLTASGKLDRAHLPAPAPSDLAARVTGDGPSSPLEAELCGLWQDVLRVDRVGRTDNFFSIGGNSLRSLQMLNRVKARLGVSVSVRDFFEGPTVADMASTIERDLLDVVSALSDDEAALLLSRLGG